MEGNNSPKPRSRIAYLDDLRVLAVLAVVNLHVTAQYWDMCAPGFSGGWSWYAVMNNLSSWCVNLFLMISGAVFLDPQRKITIRRILTRYFPRLLTAFFFWSAVYLVYQWDAIWGTRERLLALFQGHFHQWYLYLILGLYLIVPLLRKITEDRKTTEYCLLVCGAFVVVIPETVALLRYFQPPLTGFVTEVLDYWNVQLRFALPSSGMFYMVLGWYLHKYGVPGKLRPVLWVLALGAYGVRVLGILAVNEIGLPVPYMIGDFLLTAGVFLLGRDVLSRRTRGTRLVGMLSGASFGIYLVHMLVLYGVDTLLGHAPMPVHPLLSVPLTVGAVFIGSFVITLVIQKIPILNKYVV